jgi:hypothetical protein
MPIEPILPGPPSFTVQQARRAVAALVKAAAPNARVYAEWVLKSQAYLGGDVADLLGDKDKPDAGKVHCWMVGVESFDFVRGPGDQPPVIGGKEIDWLYDLAVWGFFDYAIGTSEATSQDLVDAEVQKVAATLFVNEFLALGPTQGLREVGPLSFPSIDVHPFGEGHDVHVAQGKMRIRIQQTF